MARSPSWGDLLAIQPFRKPPKPKARIVRGYASVLDPKEGISEYRVRHLKGIRPYRWFRRRKFKLSIDQRMRWRRYYRKARLKILAKAAARYRRDPESKARYAKDWAKRNRKYFTSESYRAKNRKRMREWRMRQKEKRAA